jgi:hypothetical protein
LNELLENDADEEIVNYLKSDPKKAIRAMMDLTEKDIKDYNIKSLDDLEYAVKLQPQLYDTIRRDPEGFIHYIAREMHSPEYKLYRIVVSSLCVIVVLALAGVLAAWLTKNSREAPTLITAVSCTALGLMAGIFVKVPGKSTRHAQQNLLS